MKSPFLKAFAAATLFTIISGCTSAPTHLIISPQVSIAPSNKLTNKQAQLSVIDMRTSTHIIQILEQDKAATILSSKKRLEDIIQEVLSKQWQQQGLSISETGKNRITVIIDKAIISVNQESVSYDTQSEIIVKINIDNSKQTLTSRFKTRGHNEGAFNADIAVLEQEFNQHLSTVLKKIINSKDINKFL